MKKHTPGPWTYHRTNGSPTTGKHMISGSKPGYLAEVRDCGSGDVAANARLIAEAPAMLEIIKGFLSNVMAPNPHPQDMDFVCAAAQSLIERVTGEQFQLAPYDKWQAND